ncbi:integrase/recombinase XerD [Nocardioides sp. YR527]|nr:integrase/recombinase XerD [Nocardioides sp. YR527]
MFEKTVISGDVSVPDDGVMFGDVVEDFLTDRATLTRRGLNDKSRSAYRQDITAWARQLHLDAGSEPDTEVLALVPISALTDQNVRIAYRSLRESSAAATCQRRVGTLRLFTHWLQLEGHLLVDPTLRIEAPERPSRLPAGWSVDELRRLARVASTPREGADRRRWPARDRAIFAVLVTTGVRAAELCGLTVGAIRREPDGETLVRVIGKGDKQRNLPLPPEAVDAVDVYLAELEARFGARDTADHLFVLTSGKQLRPGALNHLVETWIRLAGVPKQPGEAAHAFRHSAAKGLIRSGVPVPAVQGLLGHEDLKTTGIYVKATAADTRDAVLLSPAREVLRETAVPPSD